MDDYERALAWRREAACKGTPPRWWWPERGDAIQPEAKALCRCCPVASDCLAFALRHERDGYWAGTSSRQRRRLRRAAGIQLIPLDPVLNLTEPGADTSDADDLEETA